MQPFGCIMVDRSLHSLPAAAGAKEGRHYSPMDLVFKALADSGRRKLLDRLHDHNGQTLGDLCLHLDMSRQAVTKHLALLLRANLVVVLWHGRKKLHYLNPVPLRQIAEHWIDKYHDRIPLALRELEHGLVTTGSAKEG
jgi:DNA-binding transcriptional ArsR family regulator